MAKKGISEQIEAYGRWRADLESAIERYRDWLAQSDAADASLNLKLTQIIERLHDTLLKVAFVAEFSRGKSELINAIFFAQYGQRVVPSSAGRTTMCPTELQYDPRLPVGVRLLPIDTRLLPVPLADLRNQDDHWRFIPVDMTDVTSLRQAFDAVRETLLVPTEQARELGLYDDAQPVGRTVTPGQVEIPAWRHAIVNIPHPLLELGLVIIDTPGLNAIGTEPELTLNLIPNAHAVLFVLAADAGVTRSDIEVWQSNISKSHRSGRFVVLNKIDGLWDELRPQAENDLEIARQVVSVSNFLDLPTARVYPVSAQKGLVAKIHGDQALLRRSRLKELEHALSEEMIPQQQVIVSEQVRREFEEASQVTLNLLTVRRRNQVEQAFELNGLRGKNQAMIRQMSRRVRDERTEFDDSLRHLAALRSVFTKHSQTMFTHLSQDSLRRHVDRTRQMMMASQLSSQLKDGMNALLTAVRLDFEEADRLVGEISQMMTAMYQRFSRDYGLSLGMPLRFSTKRYFTEIEQVAQSHQRQFSEAADGEQGGADAALLRFGRGQPEEDLHGGHPRAGRLAAVTDDAAGESGARAPGAAAAAHGVGAAGDGCRRFAGRAPAGDRRGPCAHRAPAGADEDAGGRGAGSDRPAAGAPGGAPGTGGSAGSARRTGGCGRCFDGHVCVRRACHIGRIGECACRDRRTGACSAAGCTSGRESGCRMMRHPWHTTTP